MTHFLFTIESSTEILTILTRYESNTTNFQLTIVYKSRQATSSEKRKKRELNLIFHEEEEKHIRRTYVKF